MYVRGAGPLPFGSASAAPLQPHPRSAACTLSIPKLPLDSTTGAVWLGLLVASTNCSIGPARSCDSCSSMMCFLSMNNFSRLLLLPSSPRQDKPSVEDRDTSLAAATRSDPNAGGRPFHDLPQPDFLLKDVFGEPHPVRLVCGAPGIVLGLVSFHLLIPAPSSVAFSCCHPPLICRQDLIRRHGVQQRRHNAGSGAGPGSDHSELHDSRQSIGKC